MSRDYLSVSACSSRSATLFEELSLPVSQVNLFSGAVLLFVGGLVFTKAQRSKKKRKCQARRVHHQQQNRARKCDAGCFLHRL